LFPHITSIWISLQAPTISLHIINCSLCNGHRHSTWDSNYMDNPYHFQSSNG
jgi:hypothetical protein